MNLPEGWKLVPVQPTEEMIKAGCGEGDDIYDSAFIRAYDAALAAAPTPPAQEDEPVAEIVVKNTFGLNVYEAELCGEGVNLPKGTKLYTRPADEGFYGRLAAKKCQEFRKLRKAIGEHLAFVHRDGGHYRQKVGDTQAIEDATNVVLADRQQLIEMGRLRKAAADALCILDIWKEQGRFPLGVLQAELNIIERLRAALERNLTPSSTDTQSPA